MIILVCGYTSSGKSVVANHLAKRLNYSVIHTSDILKKLLTNKKIDSKTRMQKGWYEKSQKSYTQRKQDFSFDKSVDNYFLDLIKKKEDLVFDSSTLPYLLKRKKGVLRIWLKATQKVRAERMSKRNNMPYNEIIKILRKKDKFNIAHYKELYGYEFGKDISLFDYVLDTTKITQDEVFKRTLSFVKQNIKR
jgi:CMP/dCMP kinase